MAGRELDEAFLASLPEGVDPCGERGEFHTFAFAGPMFGRPIEVEVGETVERAADEYEPSVLCRYLLDLCSLFNNYYHKHHVLGNEPALTNARVVLVDCVRQVLANGMRLLGLRAPEKM